MKLQEKGGLAIGVGVALLAIAAVTIVMQMRGENDGVVTPGLFFTDDNGATYFKGDESMIPPFEHNGKTAVVAKVAKNASGKAEVVYMHRLQPAARSIVMKIRGGNKDISDQELATLATGREYKKPSDKDWTNLKGENDLRFWVMGIKCKDNSQPAYLDE